MIPADQPAVALQMLTMMMKHDVDHDGRVGDPAAAVA